MTTGPLMAVCDTADAWRVQVDIVCVACAPYRISPDGDSASDVNRAPPVVGRLRELLREEYRRAFRHDHWHVGIVDAPIRAFLEPDADLEVQWFPLPDRGKYLADPFGVARGGIADVLLEEFDFRSNRGAIAWVRVEEDGSSSRPCAVLPFPVHASYPFLVEDAGSIYCIPETAEAHEVSLYRAAEFPTRWTRTATLLAGVAGADNTVVEHGGRVWLFNTDMDDGPFSKLRIWHAPRIEGPWEPHAGNPVKTDLGSARPAGTPFHVEGELFRPSQDSSKTYGGSLVLNRVVQLTPVAYREERVAVIPPFLDGPHRHGIHTLAAIGNRTLVDGKRFGFNAWAMARALARPRRRGVPLGAPLKRHPARSIRRPPAAHTSREKS